MSRRTGGGRGSRWTGCSPCGAAGPWSPGPCPAGRCGPGARPSCSRPGAGCGSAGSRATAARWARPRRPAGWRSTWPGWPPARWPGATCWPCPASGRRPVWPTPGCAACPAPPARCGPAAPTWSTRARPRPRPASSRSTPPRSARAATPWSGCTWSGRWSWTCSSRWCCGTAAATRPSAAGSSSTRSRPGSSAAPPPGSAAPRSWRPARPPAGPACWSGSWPSGPSSPWPTSPAWPPSPPTASPPLSRPGVPGSPARDGALMAVVRSRTLAWTPTAWEAAQAAVLEAVGRQHRADPSAPGLPAQAARAAGGAGLPTALPTAALAAAGTEVVEALVAEGRLVADGPTVRLPGHAERLDPAQQALRDRVERAAGAAGVGLLGDAALAELGADRRATALLVRTGVLVAVGTGRLPRPLGPRGRGRDPAAQLPRRPPVRRHRGQGGPRHHPPHRHPPARAPRPHRRHHPPRRPPPHGLAGAQGAAAPPLG